MSKIGNLITEAASKKNAEIKTHAILETPPSIALRMINLIPEEHFISNRTTFLDPACGNGTFLKYIYFKLREHGHSHKNSIGRIFGIDKYSPANETSETFPNIIKKDFLNMEFPENWPKEFDVIISNPPYSGGEKIGGGGAGSGKSIWHSFVLKTYNMLSVGGSLNFIHPDYWRIYFEGDCKIKSSKKEKEEVFKILTGGEATHLVMQGFFPGAKIEVDFWSLVKGRKGECEITYKNGEIGFDDFEGLDTPVLPFPKSSSINSILEKVRKKNYHNQVILRKGWCGSKILDRTKPRGNYKFAHGAKMLSSQWKYDEYPHIHQYENKVVICEVGKPRPLVFTSEEEIGISDKVHYWNSSIENCNNIKNIMDSDVIEFLRAKLGDSWASLPDWFISSIDMDFKFPIACDSDVYLHFNLEEEEIKEIKDFLK
jgi:hypothetical protein